MGHPKFGIDIAREVNDAFTSAGGLTPGTLYRSPDRDPQAKDFTRLTAEVNAVAYPFQGSYQFKSMWNPDQTARITEIQVKIMGDSISVTPQQGDRVVMNGNTFYLQELIRGTDTQTSYTFTAKGTGDGAI